MLVEGNWEFSSAEKRMMGELIARIHAGDDSAWDRLMASVEPYLKWRNDRARAESADWRDVRYGAVLEAFLRAVSKYRAGGDFVAYLSMYLKRPLSLLREEDEMQTAPIRRRLTEVRDWQQEFRTAHYRDPSGEETSSAFTGWADITDLLTLLTNPESLDEGWENEDGENAGERGVASPDPTDALSSATANRAVLSLLSSWREECCRVLQENAPHTLTLFEMRYGTFFDGERPLTLEQVTRSLPPYSKNKKPTEYRMNVLVLERQMIEVLRQAGLLRDVSV